MLVIGVVMIVVVFVGIGGVVVFLVGFNWVFVGFSGGLVVVSVVLSIFVVNMLLGLVEQVVVKVVFSVVMLEIDLGCQLEEGFGIILFVEGLILINNYVIVVVVKFFLGSLLLKMMVIFFDGWIVFFMVVGVDFISDIVVVCVQGVFGFILIFLGFFLDLRVGQLVLVIGLLFGLEGIVIMGIVSVFNCLVLMIGEVGNQNIVLDVIQIDVVINFGNFGGVLVNMNV